MKPFMDVFKESFDRSLKTWPLYAWQVGFEALRVITILPCVAVALWPLWKSRAEFIGMDFSKLTDTMMALMWTSGWWMMAAGMLILYMVWWLIIEALVNGAVFGRLWAQARKGEPFVLVKYVRDGFGFFPRLIGLHLLTLVVVLAVVALAVLFTVGLSFMLGGLGLPKWAGALLISLPVGFVVGTVLLAAAVWWLVARGYVTTDHGVMESLSLAYGKCRADKGRVFWGLNLLFLLAFAAFMVIGVVFSVLQAIPFIGVVFSLINLVVSALSTAFLAVYVPAVIVAFLDEK